LAPPPVFRGNAKQARPVATVTQGAASWRGTSMIQTAFARLNAQTFQGQGNGRFPLLNGQSPLLGAAKGTIDAHFRRGSGASTVVLVQSTYNSATPPLITLGISSAGYAVGSIQDITGATVAAWEASSLRAVAQTGVVQLQVAWDSTAPIDGTSHVWVLVNGAAMPHGDFTTKPVTTWRPFQALYITTGLYCGTGFDGEMLLTQANTNAVVLVPALLKAFDLDPANVGTPSIQLTGSFAPSVVITGSIGMPSVQLAGTITPVVALSGSLTMPSTQLTGGLAVLTSPVTAWYRMAASTPVSGEWQTIANVLGGAAIVQNDTDRRLAAGTSVNGLPIGTYDGTDVLRMPLSATNFNATKFGVALHIKLANTGTQYLFAIYNNDATVRVLTWGIASTGKLWGEIYIGTNVDGRYFESPNNVVVASSYLFLRLQIDMTRTAECDTNGATADAKLRMFVNESAVALTGSSFGVGGTITTLRTPNLSTGAAVFGGVADTDNPPGPLDNNTAHGPNTYILLDTPTAAQGLALRNFEVPT